MISLKDIFRSKNKKPINQSLKATVHLLVSTTLVEARRNFRLGDYQQALCCCQQVLDLDPTSADAYRVRGVIRYKLQDLTGAAADFQYSLKLG